MRFQWCRLAALVSTMVTIVIFVTLFIRARARAEQLADERAMFCSVTFGPLGSIVRTGETFGLERRMRAHYLDVSLLRYCTGHEMPYAVETRTDAERCATEAATERDADRCYVALARELDIVFTATR